uniref:Predicted protein n=1 Tax=Hordeum vulgare subsp. vulgare TaxID=112509 RepID=F2DDB8_HORVV|nr:predicted protein [Hordeum vulgare subsp. vulgare]
MSSEAPAPPAAVPKGQEGVEAVDLHVAPSSAAHVAPASAAVLLPPDASLPPQPIRIPPPPPNTDPNYWAKLAGEVETAPPQPDPAQGVHDVIVVGGGLSGLTTAFRILDAAKRQLQEAPRVIVLESAAKFGGRTRSRDPGAELTSVDPNAGHISYGGTWVMLDNHDLLSLTWDLDHLPFQPTLFPNFTKFAVNWQNIVAHPYLLIKLRTLGSKIWHAKPGSAEALLYTPLDKLPLEAWMEAEAKSLPFPEHAKQAVRDWCFQAENFPQRPEHLWHMSTWYLARTVYIRLSHVAQTGVLLPKVMRWENGTGEVITRLQSKIRALGGFMYTEQRVQGFVSRDDHVEVSVTVGPTQALATYRAKRVVVAGAPNAAARLSYAPEPLPPLYSKFAESLRLWDDTGTQVVLVWKTRWWDDEKLSGVMLPPPDDEQTGVYGATMDLSDHGPHDIAHYKELNKHPLPTGVGVLRVLVKSSRLKTPGGAMWATEDVKRSAFKYLANVGKLKATPEELEEGFLQCWVWNHEWNPDTLGTAFYAPPVGLYSQTAPVASRPWGRFHFAGSERSPRGVQWMEGAVYMGQRKAAEVLCALYPERFGATQRRAYLDAIAESERKALELLRSTMQAHPISYVFEMIGRWAVGAVKNAINFWRTWTELHWTEAPLPLPPGPNKFALTSTVSGGVSDALSVGDAIYSREGMFSVTLGDDGRLRIVHRGKDNKHEALVVSGAPPAGTVGPYKAELLPSGNLVVYSVAHADAPFWTTNSTTVAGVYTSFSFAVGDDRGLNIWGYYPDGSRQVIWSAGTWEVHFSRPRLRAEVNDFAALLSEFNNEVFVHTHRAYRRPMKGTEEERIEKELYEQQANEKEYGRIFATVPARSTGEPDRLLQGGALRDGQGITSPHEHFRLAVVDGDLVLSHRKHGLHPIRPWEAIWGLGKQGDTLTLTAEGQLQWLKGGQVVWSSPKPAKHRPPYRLHVQDDANVALYDSHLKPLWTSGTMREPEVSEAEATATNPLPL